MKRRFNITGACYPQKHYMVRQPEEYSEMKQMLKAVLFPRAMSQVPCLHEYLANAARHLTSGEKSVI